MMTAALRKRNRLLVGMLFLALPVALYGLRVSHPVLVRKASSSLHTRKIFSHCRRSAESSTLQMSDRADDEKDYSTMERQQQHEQKERSSVLSKLMHAIQDYDSMWKRRPPMQVEDTNLLFYDIFLIINLVVSISYWVVHRMDLNFIGVAFNEGCLLSILWIASGLYTGAFLNSAVDGHFGSSSEKGGPRAAGLLALHTFVNAVNLRLVLALLVAVVQHRPVGLVTGEQLMPLEIGFGLILMSLWRILHSSFVPRM